MSGYASARWEDKRQFVGSYKFKKKRENLQDDWLPDDGFPQEGCDVSIHKKRKEDSSLETSAHASRKSFKQISVPSVGACREN